MHQLFTVGYQGLDAGQLTAKLEAADAALVDIRYTPFSRDPQWARPSLKRRLGNRYSWVPAFGNRNYRGGPIELADPEAGIVKIAALLERQPVALLCCCASWRRCHRRDAAELLVAQLNLGPVVHWTAADVCALTPN